MKLAGKSAAAAMLFLNLSYVLTTFKIALKSSRLRSPLKPGMPLPNSCLIPSARIPTFSTERNKDDYSHWMVKSSKNLSVLLHPTSSSCRILPMKNNFPFIIISVGRMFVALFSMNISVDVPINKSSVFGKRENFHETVSDKSNNSKSYI